MHGARHVAQGAGNVWYYGAMVVAGWTLMTVAMMLPTATPLLLMFRRMVSAKTNGGVLVGLVVLGYLSVWAVFGIAVQLANRAAQAIPGSADISGTWLPSTVILAAAGVYQFTPLKYACLDKCRTPLSFLMSRWQGRSELAEAFRLGIDHGLFCVGCCWSLMLLMFVVEMGNLGWMLLLGIIMAVEKNFAWGRRISAPLGIVLLGWAAVEVWRGVA